jgi:hypothetical protein
MRLVSRVWSEPLIVDSWLSNSSFIGIMDEIETIKQLREQDEQLRRENELLKAKIIELEARLAQFENAHTPASLRRGRNRKKDKDKCS